METRAGGGYLLFSNHSTSSMPYLAITTLQLLPLCRDPKLPLATTITKAKKKNSKILLKQSKSTQKAQCKTKFQNASTV
jgi:hypothetical protein